MTARISVSLCVLLALFFNCPRVSFYLGVRKIWEFEAIKIRPYVGGGLVLISAQKLTRNCFSATLEDAPSVGLWLGSGVSRAL